MDSPPLASTSPGGKGVQEGPRVPPATYAAGAPTVRKAAVRYTPPGSVSGYTDVFLSWLTTAAKACNILVALIDPQGASHAGAVDSSIPATITSALEQSAYFRVPNGWSWEITQLNNMAENQAESVYLTQQG